VQFRPEVEGLRGIAVALVVLFHAELLGLSGGFIGVDAFYVLSGFLITGLLVREMASHSTIDIASFYVRRARRILPAATVAIVLSLIGATFIVAPLDLAPVALDATMSALFIGNVHFASGATDYFGSATPSPFLHFWSLGVEEQFYLFWPLLLLLAARLRRVGPFIIGVFAVSLALSLLLTRSDPVWAFYGLPTRAWQLALGALIAVYGSRLARLPSAPVAICGWMGLGALAISALAIDHTTEYPGLAAIVPTFGVASLIVAGDRRWGPGRVLTVPPFRFLGRISFSLYLYHWPVLTLAAVALGDLAEPARWLLVGVGIVIGVASWRLVEEPFRRAPSGARSAGRPLALAATAVCAVVVVAQLVDLHGSATVAQRGSELSAEVASLAEAPLVDQIISMPATEGTSVEDVTIEVPPTVAAPATTSPPFRPARPAKHELQPRLVDARYDGDGLNDQGCGLSLAGSQPPLCQLGAREGSFTVALVGDSHAAQWFPAIDAIARARAWRVMPLTKDSCIFLDMRIESLHLEREYAECTRWRQAVLQILQREKPDLVVVSSSRWVHPVNPLDADLRRQGDAMARLLRLLPGRVAVIADTPLSFYDVPACLSRSVRPPDGCSTSRGYALTAHLMRDKFAADISGAWLIDPAEWLCDEARCPAIIDWTIVYRDDHHLTATFVRSLAPALDAQLAEALGAPVATGR
jgi:peptidoglycan/LPS O-acetylase OafA/YrhL